MENGKYSGRGVLQLPNGERYDGAFEDNLMHGHGTYHYVSGDKYVGDWKHGRKHGQGVRVPSTATRACACIDCVPVLVWECASLGIVAKSPPIVTQSVLHHVGRHACKKAVCDVDHARAWL